MMTRNAYTVPSWAIAILFWRKVLAVESKESRRFDPAIDRGVATAHGAREMNLGGPHQTRGRNGIENTERIAQDGAARRFSMIRVPIAATYRLTAFREAVAHVQRGGQVTFDVDGAI